MTFSTWGRIGLLFVLLAATFATAQDSWSFAISGDSRNCGDVIVPAIAAGVHKDDAQFYWHMGDFRAIFAIDEDIAERATGPKPATLAEYQRIAWQDAIDNQIASFGETPFFVGIGNHETILPKTRAEFVRTFAQWLNAPVIRDQRQQDNPSATSVKTYYHWRERGIEFVYLDNATDDEFDPAQMTWFEKLLATDGPDPAVKTVVVAMHAALPNSLAAGHSMNNWRVGDTSGTRVYTDLLNFREQSKKNVYVLASHSHFYMANVFKSDYWKSNGGVLPGWIVGTAGAHRYKLPEDAGEADAAKTNVYGYLLATAHSDGTVDFKFRELKESAIPPEIVSRFGERLVHKCFVDNSDVHH